MAAASAERRYTLTMNQSEAQTLLSILSNVYIADMREPSPFQTDSNNLIHLHEVLVRAGGLSNEYTIPLGAGD